LLHLRVTATEFAGLDASQFQQVLVTEYSPGAGIGWHKDGPEFEHVFFSLLSPCLFRLRRKRGNGWERASIELQPRSAYLLSGSARTDWQHSIPPVDKLRYSDLQRLSPLNAQNRNVSLIGVPPRLIASLFEFVRLGCFVHAERSDASCFRRRSISSGSCLSSVVSSLRAAP